MKKSFTNLVSGFLLICGLLIFTTMLFNGSVASGNAEEEDYYSTTTESAQRAFESSTLTRISTETVLLEAQVAYDNAMWAEALSMKALAMSKYSDLLVAGYDTCSDRMLELGEKSGVEQPACDPL